MEKRACPFCGKPVGATLDRCPFCREAIAQARPAAASGGGSLQGRVYIRRGLLWALLAGVIYYFAGGHSGLHLPVDVPPFVNQILTSLLFLAGAAMALYGVFLSLKG